MRKIKFRAWCKEDKMMFDVFGFDVNHVTPWQRSSDHKTHTIPHVEDCVLMQYTGLRDVNGIEIYEGDIVYCQELKHDMCILEYISEVFFEYGCWLVHESEMCDVELYLYNSSPTKMPLTEIKVIGNVYENPELLTQQTPSLLYGGSVDENF